MELTLDQARTYLAGLGIVLPDFLLQIVVNKANSIDACLIGAGYDDDTAILIKLALISLLGLAQGEAYVTSQTAPSGASRSFRYGTLSDRWKSALSLLRSLDPSGCALPLVPADPTQTAHGGLWVAKGGCFGGCK